MGRFTKSLLLSAPVVAVVSLIGFWPGKYQYSTAVNGGLARSSQEHGKTADINATVQRLLNDKVTAFYQWKMDTGATLLCIARDSGKHQFPGEPTNVFSIIDGQGKLLYEIDGVEIYNIATSWMLRDTGPQLVVSVNGGGRQNDLKILDYQNGKITELLDSDDQDYSIAALIKPQFRSGVIPAKEPYEILMIRGVGLASPEEKYLSVYRYTNGSYEFNGEISQNLLDDYMEQLLKKKTR
jgi:hypothetical protein